MSRAAVRRRSRSPVRSFPRSEAGSFRALSSSSFRASSASRASSSRAARSRTFRGPLPLRRALLGGRQAAEHGEGRAVGVGGLREPLHPRLPRLVLRAGLPDGVAAAHLRDAEVQQRGRLQRFPAGDRRLLEVPHGLVDLAELHPRHAGVVGGERAPGPVAGLLERRGGGFHVAARERLEPLLDGGRRKEAEGQEEDRERLHGSLLPAAGLSGRPRASSVRKRPARRNGRKTSCHSMRSSVTSRPAEDVIWLS